MGGEYGKPHPANVVRGVRINIVLNGFDFYLIPTVFLPSDSTKPGSQSRMTLFFAAV